jgi:hypothetical protein
VQHVQDGLTLGGGQGAGLRPVPVRHGRRARRGRAGCPPLRVLTRLGAFLHTRGIAGADGISRAVLEDYLAGLHAAMGGRPEHGTHVDPGNPVMAGAAGEITGDVEMAHEIAPDANILLVEVALTATTVDGELAQAMTAENDVVASVHIEAAYSGAGMPRRRPAH